MRTLQNLKTLDGGFRKEHVVLFNVDTSAVGFLPAQRASFYADLHQRLRVRPGVVSVAMSRRSPIDFSSELRKIEVPGFLSTELQGVSPNVVTPEYFSTFGVGLLGGRLFTAEDRKGAPKVAIVSDSMARHFFVTRVTVELRTSGERGASTALAASARDEARALSKDAVVSYVRTMDEQIDASLIQERVLATLSTAFGALALGLSAVGLYGVMAYTVARRSREIGIKLALGAARSSVLWHVLRETMVLAATGIAAGLFVAVVMAESVSALLFGLAPRDPLTLVASAAVLLAVTLVAGYLPARKASAVDPMRALRTE